MTDMQNRTDFGYRSVLQDEKSDLVRGVFDSVASDYDLMNDLMSGGIHRLWKSVLLDRLAPTSGQQLIDVAGGTGDIAIGFLKRADERYHLKDSTKTISHPATAIICDINHAMLAAGKKRTTNQNYKDRLQTVCGNGEMLPLPSRIANAYTIAFGIRNVTHMDKALSEAFRVLKPGGRFICLEFSHPITGHLQHLYDQYSFRIIPWLGEKIAKDRASYQYLIESIRRFPTQEAFAARIANAGFSRVKVENLSGGIAALHMAWRL